MNGDETCVLTPSGPTMCSTSNVAVFFVDCAMDSFRDYGVLPEDEVLWWGGAS